jgi:hypothetical protein
VLLAGALDRPDHRRAAQGADERLLDRLVEGVVDAGDLRDALGTARAGGQETRGPRAVGAGPRRLVSAVVISGIVIVGRHALHSTVPDGWAATPEPGGEVWRFSSTPLN